MRNNTDNESKEKGILPPLRHLVARVYYKSTHVPFALVRSWRMQVREQAQMVRKVRTVCIKYICDKITINIAWKVSVINKRTKLINIIVTAKQI